jgi:phage-related protein
MSPNDKPLAWLHGEIKTPPLSEEARLEAGYLLRLLQRGESIGMPHSKPMPTIGPRCHELRIQDKQQNAIVLADVFSKKTGKTPKSTIELCRKRLKDYDNETEQESKARK